LSGTHGQTDNDAVSINFVYYERGSVSLWFKPAELYNYNSILDNSADGNDWEMWVYGTDEFAGRIQSGYVRGSLRDGSCRTLTLLRLTHQSMRSCRPASQHKDGCWLRSAR